jgi:hypothetical protein
MAILETEHNDVAVAIGPFVAKPRRISRVGSDAIKGAVEGIGNGALDDLQVADVGFSSHRLVETGVNRDIWKSDWLAHDNVSSQDFQTIAGSLPRSGYLML